MTEHHRPDHATTTHCVYSPLVWTWLTLSKGEEHSPSPSPSPCLPPRYKCWRGEGEWRHRLKKASVRERERWVGSVEGEAYGGGGTRRPLWRKVHLAGVEVPPKTPATGTTTKTTGRSELRAGHKRNTQGNEVDEENERNYQNSVFKT